MSRPRTAVVVVVIALFIIVGGVLTYATQSHAGGNREINVSVTGGSSMAPSTWTAHPNDKVTIKLTSDTDGEVHLHGYDIAFTCSAGQAVTKTFTADKWGQFDIEWEATSTHLGNLVVT